MGRKAHGTHVCVKSLRFSPEDRSPFPFFFFPFLFFPTFLIPSGTVRRFRGEREFFFDVSVKHPWVRIVFHNFHVLGGWKENALPRVDQTEEAFYSSTSSCPMGFPEDHRDISLVVPVCLETYLNSFS